MTGKLNPVGREPVLIQAAATIVVWAATRYGLQISDETALQIAGVAFVILAPFVRQLVKPVAKIEAEDQAPADDSTLRKVVSQTIAAVDPHRAPLAGNIEVRDPIPPAPPKAEQTTVPPAR